MRARWILWLCLLPAWAGAQISSVGVTTKTQSSAASAVSIDVPAATQAGDLLVVQLALHREISSIAPPSGWGLVIGVYGYGQTLAWLYRQADGSEAASYSFPFGVSARHAAAMVALRGVDPADPFIAAGFTGGPTSSGYAASDSVDTTPVADAWLLAAFSVSNGNRSFTTPGGMDELVDLGSSAGPNGISMALFGQAIASPGSTGARLTSVGSSGDDYLSLSLALRPTAVSALDHIRILHDGSGITCNAETVTFVACADAGCSSLYTDPVSLTPLASAGIGASYTPATLSFSGGSATVSLRATSAGTTLLGANLGAPAAANPTRCFIGASESCSMSFADSGLLLDVPDHVADTPTDFTVAAVRSSDNARQCVPAFANVTRSISLYSGYANPASGTLALSVQGSSIAGSSPGTAISLDFDASGTATASLRYADVGELSLNAVYTGSAGVGDSGLSLLGSDHFVVRPADFVLDIAGNPGVAVPAGGVGEVFRKAGQPFTVAVTARNASGVATPNFGRETPTEAVRLETTLVAPAGGNAPEVVARSGFGAFSAGAASGDWVWDEVGAIELRPRLDDGSYLGSGDVLGIRSGVIGRFVPDHLQLGPAPLSVEPACASGGFSYFGQPFGFATGSEPALTISAHSASSGYPLTGNYEGTFWRLGGGFAGRGYLDTASDPDVALSLDSSGSSLASSGATAPPFDGSQSWRVLGDRLVFPRGATPQAPLAATVTLQLTAADLRDADGVCFDPDHDGNCDGYRLAASATTPLRWGRAALDNAFGPELFDLRLPLRAEYFDGLLFLPHAADGCSAAGPVSLAEANGADTLQPADTCVLDNGSPGSSGAGCATPATPARQFATGALAGQWNLWLQAPGSGHAGVLDVGVEVPDWLRYDWHGAGPESPAARVGFGVFAGDRALIYQREVY